MDQNMLYKAGNPFLSEKLLIVMKIAGIFLFLTTLQLNANAFKISPKTGSPEPPVEIKGRVVNENGEPVTGASVLIKGTNKGASTNNAGNFTLTYNNSNKVTLVISAVGCLRRW
jgi:hypothetical protein